MDIRQLLPGSVGRTQNRGGGKVKGRELQRADLGFGEQQADRNGRRAARQQGPAGQPNGQVAAVCQSLGDRVRVAEGENHPAAGAVLCLETGLTAEQGTAAAADQITGTHIVPAAAALAELMQRDFLGQITGHAKMPPF